MQPLLIVKNGRVVDLRKSGQAYKCAHCGLIINIGILYYSVTPTSARRIDTSPEQVHEDCIDSFLGG